MQCFTTFKKNSINVFHLNGTLLEKRKSKNCTEFIKKIDNYKKVKEFFLRDLAIALATHDIGKCANEYQLLFNDAKKETLNNDGSEILSKKTINNPHNVYSWAYLIGRFKDMSLDIYSPITSAVLYHHIVATNKKTHYDIISSLSKLPVTTKNIFPG